MRGEYEVLPAIHSVKYDESRTQFVFTLPNGVDPSLVKKHDFVFRQWFGTQTEVAGNLKKFVVTVHNGKMPSRFNYKFIETEHRVPIICGINRLGELVTYDMAATPHLLIAGETGSGKSTQLRSILTHLILSRGPDDLRLVLGDMKLSEFHLFRGIAQVDALCYSADDIAEALGEVSDELRRRGELLNKQGLAHISELNDPPPVIVVAIDEFALLRDEREVMRVIEDISAIGRALDVYLILSQQRADRDVMPGRLKQNLTVRMAFRHADRINSRITIGTYEAADIGIEERGRFYLKRERLELLQGPFLSVKKARELLKPYKVPHVGKNVTSGLQNDPLGLLGGDDDAQS
jgi:S-DNA-T family DNA segregation ATPase FtsK/SpoIIIE